MLRISNNFFGAILLISGTTIGAGMLALPVVTSFSGFLPSTLVFLFIWALMLVTAYFFLDVNLSVKGEPNLISMAGRTMGLPGKTVSWIFYLLLLYALLAAYIAASAPLFARGVQYILGWDLPCWLPPFFLPIVFGTVIYFGTKGVDYANRLLMLGLVLSYVLIVLFVPAHIESANFTHVDFAASLLSIPIVLTSFGFHIIIPSLTTYLEHNKKLLKKALLIGSLIPFVIYIIWQVLVLGVVPLSLLSQAWVEGASATDPLAQVLGMGWIKVAARFFSFFAIVTSFLGVSLSLSDFLKDGCKLKKTWEGRLFAYGLTFIPPIVFVFTCRRGFYLALEYAGAFVAILLGVIPAAMAWKLKGHPFYSCWKGKALIILVILVCLSLVLVDIVEKRGLLQGLVQDYIAR